MEYYKTRALSCKFHALRLRPFALTAYAFAKFLRYMVQACRIANACAPKPDQAKEKCTSCFARISAIKLLQQLTNLINGVPVFAAVNEIMGQAASITGLAGKVLKKLEHLRKSLPEVDRHELKR